MSNGLKFFTDSEFRHCVPSCERTDCCSDSLARLDQARQFAGVPFKLNSAYRSRSYELSKGRSGNSAHVLGRAFDVSCRSNDVRWRIVSAAIKAGFTRIGIYPTFIHLDDSVSHPSHLIWLG